MIPWEQLAATTVPGSSTEMTLHRRGDVFSIRVGGVELMNNWIYDIDCGLARHGCEALADRQQATVLIGGLGMGFTLARCLSLLGPASEVVVAELVPAVVTWNETHLGHLAEHPLRDPRVRVEVADVGQVMRSHEGRFDAILLDVDNGPEGLSRKDNDALYGPAGLAAARRALAPRGILAVWSLSGDAAFTRALHQGGFAVDEHHIKKRGGRARQTIFVGRPAAPGDTRKTPGKRPASPRRRSGDRRR